MDRLLADLRFALRRARHRPGFTVIAVLSLALGIGANTAIFSLVNALLLRRAPIPHPEQIVEVYQKQQSVSFAPWSYPDYVAFRDATKALFTRVSIGQFTIVPRDMGDHVETLPAELVNGDYFPLLGLQPAAGRLFGPEDDIAPGAHPVVVLGYDYWQRAYGGEQSVVGREIRLGGRGYTIVGVAPRAWEGTLPGLAPSMYVPVKMIDQVQPTESNDQLVDMGNHGMFLKGRLAPGVSIAQARTAAASFTTEMQRRFPKYWPGTTSLVVIPESDIAVNPLIDSVVVPAAAALMAVVGLVLLVACANLASFLLAQARDRQREIAIRLAIGASRRSLIRQLLAESLVLSAVGGIAGVLLSRVALGALLTADLPVPIPITLDAGIDFRVLLFAIGASLTAGLLFGLLPALQATRAAVIETIKNENTGGPARRFTVRSALVVGQVSVSLLLLITASLFLRSLQARANIDPGFGKTPAGMVWFAVPTDRYDAQRRLLLIDEIEKRVREIPGVTSVGVTGNILLNTLTQQDRTVNVEGFVPPKGQLGFVVDAAAADSGYFEAAGVKILRGRPFTAADAPGAPHVAVINEVMANTFWAGQDPVGRTFRVDTAVYRVVGVSRTTKVRSLGEAPRPFLFTSFRQEFSANVMLVAGTRGDADRTAVQMLAALRAVDPSLMVVQAKTMARHLATMVLPAQLGAIAFALFAGLALLLALIGVYGVVSYAVARRTREVGIRLAVGAQPNAVIRLLMREGTVLVAIGGAVGLVLGIAMARALASLLYGVALTDPLTFIGAPLLLFAVGVLAAFIPARRASRIDPAGVLRAE